MPLTKDTFTISDDLTAFVERDNKGNPCQLVVRSEKLDDYDTYLPKDGEWELSHDSLSQRATELNEAATELIDGLWDNAEFATWADALCPKSNGGEAQ